MCGWPVELRILRRRLTALEKKSNRAPFAPISNPQHIRTPSLTSKTHPNKDPSWRNETLAALLFTNTQRPLARLPALAPVVSYIPPPDPTLYPPRSVRLTPSPIALSAG